VFPASMLSAETTARGHLRHPAAPSRPLMGQPDGIRVGASAACPRERATSREPSAGVPLLGKKEQTERPAHRPERRPERDHGGGTDAAGHAAEFSAFIVRDRPLVLGRADDSSGGANHGCRALGAARPSIRPNAGSPASAGIMGSQRFAIR
jgi:hypothetical protein